jgi:threonine/homoserine/homoserine lactone efflux protein
MIIFLTKVILISLSGVMAPGPVTAAALAHGTKSKNSGALMAVGHGLIEIPLIFLLMVGLDRLIKNHHAKIAIGITGGAFLLWMGSSMLAQIKKANFDFAANVKTKPLITGILLSATNPYFLFWWATVGLNLAIDAKNIGKAALVIFAIVHWLCDLIWLWLLTWTSSKGAALLSPKKQKYILAFCASALIIFGLKFLYDAIISI